MTNIELYEALKPTVGENAARMVAEGIRETQELATKSDLRELESRLRADVATTADLRELESRLKADFRGWMLQFFVPLWIGVYGTLGALVVSIVVKS